MKKVDSKQTALTIVKRETSMNLMSSNNDKEKETALTTTERTQLRHHEAVIKAGRNTFVAVGVALTAIRDQRLYRADFPTLQEYCEQRWGWGRKRASQLIQAASVVQQLPEHLSTRVDNEKAARALAKVPVEKRAAVVEAATKDGKSSTKDIKVQSKVVDVEPHYTDVDGVAIPKKLVPMWLRGVEIAAVLSQISSVKMTVKAAQGDDDPLWRQANHTAIMGDLSKAWTGIQAAKPYAVCPQCQGHPEASKCRLCLGVGLIGKFRYQAVPAELLNVRKQALGKKK